MNVEQAGKLIHLMERVADSLDVLNKLLTLRVNVAMSDHNLSGKAFEFSAQEAVKESEFRHGIAQNQQKGMKILERSVPPPEPWQQGPDEGGEEGPSP